MNSDGRNRREFQLLDAVEQQAVEWCKAAGVVWSSRGGVEQHGVVWSSRGLGGVEQHGVVWSSRGGVE